MLLYGCEAWTVYRRHVKIFERFHTSCLQRILRQHWRNKAPPADIRQRASCLSIEAILSSRLLRLTGHVIRMLTNRLSRRVPYGELVEDDRYIGDQFKRYKDTVNKTILKKCGVGPAQLETAAVDRNNYRNVSRTGVEESFGIQRESFVKKQFVERISNRLSSFIWQWKRIRPFAKDINHSQDISVTLEALWHDS